MRISVFFALLLGLLLVSTTAADPCDTLWWRLFGGSGYEEAYSLEATLDGGYIVAGYSTTVDPSGDFYVVKTDAEGNLLWDNKYGGSDSDVGRSVQQTSEGGYIIAGQTRSYGGGNDDVYLVKVDSVGNFEWDHAYGGTVSETGFLVQQTSDGGYIIAGFIWLESQNMDMYLVKTDASGDTLWVRNFGGGLWEKGYAVRQTPDGGYIVAGFTASFGAGAYDVYLIKVDADGNLLWDRTYGGTSYEGAYAAQITSDGGYVLAGWTSSFGSGGDDMYLVKTDADGNFLWQRTYGGTDIEWAQSVRQTSDGGYILAGWTYVEDYDQTNTYLVKTDSDGNLLWECIGQEAGPEESVALFDVREAPDGGYVAAGKDYVRGENGDFCLVKYAGEQRPTVSIQIIPDDPPVTVPQGGRFGYTGTVTNNTEDPQITDAWVMAVGPLEGVYGPFRNFQDLQLGPSQARSAHLNQQVHNRAPLGFYNYIAYCGDYPATVVDSSLFQIEVVAGPLTKAGEAGWVLTGSFLEGDLTDVPSEFALLSNYPNPFNAQTVIQYQLPASSSVKLEIYNLIGEKVATLLNGAEEAGYKSVTWDASEISSGIYFYKLSAGDYTETKRMMLVK